MKLKDKIKFMRESKGLTQEDLARISGVSIQSIKRYETKDNSNITIDNLEKIVKAFDTRIDYFLSPSMSLSQEILSPSPQILSLNPQKNVPQFVPQSNVVNPQKSVVNSVVNPKSDSILIPVYDEVFASAGFGRVNDENISFYASFDKAFLKSYFKLSSLDSLSFIRCDGDSMTPTLPPNARLLAQHRTEFKEGQIVLAKIDEDLFVKRLQKQPSIKLLSDNAAYESIALQNKQYELLCVIIGFLNTVH